MYVNRDLPDVQAGFRKGRGTRHQIANLHWIIEKAREFQKNIYFCFIDYSKPLTVWITTNCGKFFKRWEFLICLTYLPPMKPVCRSRSNNQNWTWNNGRVPNWERSTSRLYIVTLLVICIMRNAGLDEAQAGIKITGRNISNLRYADDTSLMQKEKN